MNFLELVKARYSVRNYEERPIEQNKLDYIMECVRLAPSAVNFQPWKFAVITEKKLLEALKSAYPREWIKTHVSGNLAVSMIRKVGLPTYEIQNKDYGYRKFNKKVHIMEQNP